jgi:hypothetical protein
MKRADVIVEEEGIYINDENGTEIVSWTIDEWKEDTEFVVPAIANAIKMALMKGPDALKTSIKWKNSVGYDPNDFNLSEYVNVINPAIRKFLLKKIEDENNRPEIHNEQITIAMAGMDIIEIIFGAVDDRGELVGNIPEFFEGFKVGFGVEVNIKTYENDGKISLEWETYYVTLIMDRNKDGLTVKEIRDMIDDEF